jgi:uncharacterized protein (DUF1800 family)
MLQLSSRAAPASAFAKATIALLGAAALLAAIPEAKGQMTRAAAIGVFKPNATFALDGDYDNVADATVVFGQPGDIGMLGDIGGAGARGTVVYRNGVWLFDLDRDGIPDKTVTWGASGDVPMIADMDADGKDDLVLYRSGQWLVNTKADGTVQYTFQYGGSRGDVPVLGDVNGDGQVDLIVFNRGSWHISFDRKKLHQSHSHSMGAGNETPLAFDYNGDGKADLVVMSNGTWSVKSVSGPVQTTTFTFGWSNDRPLYFGPGAKADPVLDAARFLNNVTFGATEAEVARAAAMGYVAYVDEQLATPHTGLPYMPWYPQNRPNDDELPYCQYAAYAYGVPYSSASPCYCASQTGTVNQCQRDVYTNFRLQNELFTRAVAAPDQLRHRVAWALSQILVTSNTQDPIAYPMRNYQQWLLDLAFGNYEWMLYAITLSPWMGNYLDMVRNNGSPAAQAAGVVPNENYARELLQLFSIGLWELKNDGTLLLDAQNNPIPTYDQDDIVELSRALTGWAYPPIPGATPPSNLFNRPVNYIGDLVPIEGPLNGTGSTNYHDIGAKSVMGFTQPAGMRANEDVLWAVHLAANHPNTGVYIGRQLIQQLVTSNPSPGYVQRVVAVWNNNGQGVRGDLKAVVRAILLDWEAVKPRNPVLSIHGKLKEPVLYISNFLRSVGATTDGVYLRGQSSGMGQNVYNAPTVFNYYQQDYQVPGTTLSGPPFQIFDATSYFARVNFIYNLAYNTTCDSSTNPQICGPARDATVFGSTGTKINWAPLKALADDPAALVDAVSMKLLFTKLPKAIRTQMINAVAAVNVSVPMTSTQRLDRVRMAVYLVGVSPQYQVGF